MKPIQLLAVVFLASACSAPSAGPPQTATDVALEEGDRRQRDVVGGALLQVVVGVHGDIMRRKQTYFLRCRRNASSSPTMPRRKVSTQITKMMPWMMVTQAPNWAR